jgi:hypothetical protein
MDMILLNLKLLRKLAIDGFDQLSNRVEQMMGFWRKLLFLITPYHSIRVLAQVV